MMKKKISPPPGFWMCTCDRILYYVYTSYNTVRGVRVLRKKFNLVGPFFFTKTERSKHTSSKRKNRIKTRIIDLTPPKFNKHL